MSSVIGKSMPEFYQITCPEHEPCLFIPVNDVAFLVFGSIGPGQVHRQVAATHDKLAGVIVG
jgi:hypothetical protein